MDGLITILEARVKQYIDDVQLYNLHFIRLIHLLWCLLNIDLCSGSTESDDFKSDEAESGFI